MGELPASHLRSILFACLAISVSLIALAVVVLISGLSPKWWILLLILPSACWLEIGRRSISGGVETLLHGWFLWSLTGAGQMWGGWLTGRWLAEVLTMSIYSPAFVLLSFGTLVVFVGVGASVFRALRNEYFRSAGM